MVRDAGGVKVTARAKEKKTKGVTRRANAGRYLFGSRTSHWHRSGARGHCGPWAASLSCVRGVRRLPFVSTSPPPASVALAATEPTAPNGQTRHPCEGTEAAEGRDREGKGREGKGKRADQPRVPARPVLGASFPLPPPPPRLSPLFCSLLPALLLLSRARAGPVGSRTAADGFLRRHRPGTPRTKGRGRRTPPSMAAAHPPQPVAFLPTDSAPNRMRAQWKGHGVSQHVETNDLTRWHSLRLELEVKAARR
jgi:hypothetical protein